MRKLTVLIKSQPVLSIVTVLAAVSCILVPPDAQYLGYCNFKVLAVLF